MKQSLFKNLVSFSIIVVVFDYLGRGFEHREVEHFTGFSLLFGFFAALLLAGIAKLVVFPLIHRSKDYYGK